MRRVQIKNPDPSKGIGKKSNDLIILQPVALAAPDDGVDGDGADAHFHNGGLAAGGKGLALLDLLPGLDVNVAQPVEDRAHARAVVDDQRNSVVTAQILGQVDLAAGGGNDQLTAGGVLVRPPAPVLVLRSL